MTTTLATTPVFGILRLADFLAAVLYAGDIYGGGGSMGGKGVPAPISSGRVDPVSRRKQVTREETMYNNALN